MPATTPAPLSSDVITLINDNIKPNGANEITANVLNPVLRAMVDQINALVGNPSEIPNGLLDVISALNSILENMPDTRAVHVGLQDPNEVSPLSYKVADFYHQKNGTESLALYIFTGTIWAEIT